MFNFRLRSARGCTIVMPRSESPSPVLRAPFYLHTSGPFRDKLPPDINHFIHLSSAHSLPRWPSHFDSPLPRSTSAGQNLCSENPRTPLLPRCRPHRATQSRRIPNGLQWPAIARQYLSIVALGVVGLGFIRSPDSAAATPTVRCGPLLEHCTPFPRPLNLRRPLSM